MGDRLRRTIGFLAILGLLLTPLLPQPSAARQWRATPQALAQEYSQIIDQRSAQEVVLLLWLSPPLVPADASGQQAREILSKYMVIGMIHAEFGADGSPTFRKIPEISMEPNQKPLRGYLDESVLPPTVLGGLKAIQAIFQQTLGPLGRGTHWFVFDAADLSACGSGGFVIPYDGVRYSYDTPIPGCPKA